MNCNEKNEKNLVNAYWKYLALFLLGLITGFVFAPVKNGVKICSENENSMNATDNGIKRIEKNEE